MSKSSKNNTKKITKEGLRSALSIFKYIKPYIFHFVIGMICLAFGSLIFMVFPLAAGEMANNAAGISSESDKAIKQVFANFRLVDYGLFFLIVLIIQGVLSYARTILFAIVSENGMADLRKDLYEKIISQPIAFFEERRVGELTSRITADVEQLQSALSITLAEFFRQIITMIVGVAIIAILMPRLSLIMLLTFPIIVIG